MKISFSSFALLIATVFYCDTSSAQLQQVSPVVNLAGQTTGTISTKTLKTVTKLELNDASEAKIESFMLTFVDGTAYEEPNSGDSLSKFSLSLFAKAKPNSLILIDRIKLRLSDGTVQEYPDLKLKFNVE
jgi:hypothetical protein